MIFWGVELCVGGSLGRPAGGLACGGLAVAPGGMRFEPAPLLPRLLPRTRAPTTLMCIRSPEARAHIQAPSLVLPCVCNLPVYRTCTAGPQAVLRVHDALRAERNPRLPAGRFSQPVSQPVSRSSLGGGWRAICAPNLITTAAASDARPGALACCQAAL